MSELCPFMRMGLFYKASDWRNRVGQHTGHRRHTIQHQKTRPSPLHRFALAMKKSGPIYTPANALLECIDASLELGHALVDMGSSLKFKEKGKRAPNNPYHGGMTGPATREKCF